MALFGILGQHNVISGIGYAVCFATGGVETGSTIWLRLICTVGNFRIGQIDTKAAFLNGLLTFGGSIPINHNLQVLGISMLEDVQSFRGVREGLRIRLMAR